MKIQIPRALREKWEQMPLKKRQYAFVAATLIGGTALFSLVLSLGAEPKKPIVSQEAKPSPDSKVTNLTAPGSISPLDEWIGTAGHKLAKYEQEKAAQDQINAKRDEFEKRVNDRLEELAKAQSSAASAAPQAPAPAPQPANVPPPDTSPAAGPPRMPPGAPPAMGADAPPVHVEPQPVVPALSRVTLGSIKRAPGAGTVAGAAPAGASAAAAQATKGDTGTFLPVSFARGVLLGGIDAPTGGAAQGNPQPVLIRLSDNAVLPNRYRAQVRECFVVAAGYGDISSERALFRTISLSCVRHDGTALEADIQGSIFGEDGKLGMRGRLVTKQGQMLANALRAGIVGGIGDGFARSGTTMSTGAYGSVMTESGDAKENMQRGVMRGFGSAMNQLADYYVKLAEKTFPIIEIDAGRQVDVVLTKGVYLPTLASGAPEDGETTGSAAGERL